MMHWLDIPAEDMTYQWLADMITVLEESTGLSESPWIEVKSKRNGPNIAEAVGALANANGGLVLVGVLDDNDAKGAVGADRIVGVPKKEYESITSSLAASLANEMPEMRTIAIDGKPDQIAIVLRVDSDAFAHPVVVGGKIKVRVESSSINADRATVEKLVDRDRSISNGCNGIYVTPVIAEYVPFWDDSVVPFVTFRVAGSLLLNRQVLIRPWIPSDAISEAQRTMEAAKVPTAFWLMGPLYDRELEASRRWNVTMRRSRDFRMRIAPQNPAKWPIEATGAGASATLNGQRLDASVAAWLPASEDAKPLSIEDAHLSMLALLTSLRDFLSAIAEHLTPGSPARWGIWRGWIQPPDRNRPIDDVLDLSRWERAPSIGSGDHSLPEYTTHDVSDRSFDGLVREWLLLLLANNGILGHETNIESLRTPYWLKE